MAFRNTLVFVLVVCYTQVHGSWMGMGGMGMGPMGPMGPVGPIGPMGPFGPYGGANAASLNLKFTLLSQMVTARREFTVATNQMTTDLDAAKNRLTTQAQNSDLAVQQQVAQAQASGKNVQACVDAYTTSSAAITAKIDEIALYSAFDQELAIRNNIALITAKLGSSKAVMSQCKLQFAAATQAADLTACVTTGTDTAQQEATAARELVTSGIQDLKAGYTTFIHDTETDVNTMIGNATNEFTACVGAQVVV